LTDGKLIPDLSSGNKTLTIGTSSSVGTISGGSATSYIVAYDDGTNISKIKYFVNGNSTYSFPIGDATSYTPLSYAQTSATINPAGAYLEVYTKGVKIPQLNAATVGNYLKRYWEVNATGITNPLYNITYTYTDGDIQGVETNFAPVKYSSGTWYKPASTTFTTGTTQGTYSFSASTNQLTWSGLSTFSQYTAAANGSVALPVELISFQANCSNQNTVEISWTTATEYNTNYFRVDKSRNGSQWDALGTIGAAGFSTNLIDYVLTDYFPQAGINYYRLTQYDMDGVFETFDIKAIVCKDQQSGTVLNTYPNPSSGNFHVDLQTDELEGDGILLITDAKGAVVHSQNISLINGNNNFLIPHLDAEPGMYYISVKQGAYSVTTKHSLR
jgi:hypothetical protein